MERFLSAPRPPPCGDRPPRGSRKVAEPHFLESTPRPTTYVVRPPRGMSKVAKPHLLMRPIFPAVVVVLSHLCTTAVLAQAGSPFSIPVYTGTPLMTSIGVVTQQTLNRQISAIEPATDNRPERRRSSKSPPPARAEISSTLLVGSAQAGMPARMAAHLPAAARPDVERLYRVMLDKYPPLMNQLGVPAGDVAAAVATFLAGSYVAYRGVDFPDQHFKPLYEQVREIIGANAAFARASPVQRREMYEQMAILGMYMAVTREALKQRPDPQLAAAMKLAAKNYLQQFMKVDPERMRITDKGLIVN